jgi:ADP-ribose pyrophosphatase YjhB (NUDIX family)
MKKTSWKLLNREIIHQSKFLEIFDDTVELPDKTIFDHYSVIKKPDIVIVVATTDNKIIMIDEYKYAANAVMRVLPAGHLKLGERPIAAAKRELLEETGYSGDDFKHLGVLREYPTKDLHQIHVVLANNMTKQSSKKLHQGEGNKLEIKTIESIKSEIIKGKIQSSSTLGALSISGLLF